MNQWTTIKDTIASSVNNIFASGNNLILWFRSSTPGIPGDALVVRKTDGTDVEIDVDGVPIGSIQSWHKDLPGVPALTSNWVQCDGQVLVDAASPLNGQTIPNLNGQARFLRGAAVSGTEQVDDFKSHNHQGGVVGNTPQGSFGLIRVSPGGANTATAVDVTPGEPDILTPPTNIPLEGGAETRPINMSVVWIIKIK